MKSVGELIPFPFFSLPMELGATICSGWLHGKAFGKLDSACMSHRVRPMLLMMFRYEGFRVDIHISSIGNDNKRVRILNWLSKRKVSANEIYLNGTALALCGQLDYKSVLRCTRKLCIASLRPDFAVKIVSLAPALTELSAAEIRWDEYAPSEMQKTTLVRVRLPHLLNIDIRGDAPHQTTLGIAEFVGALDCSNLQVVEVSYISDFGEIVEAILEQLSLALARNGSKLSKLTLCDLFLSDQVMLSLLTHCRELTDISIEDCDGLSLATFAYLGRFCPKLRILAINKACNEVLSFSSADHPFLILAHGCTSLERIHISKVHAFDDQALQIVYKHMPALHELVIFYCANITGTASAPVLAGTRCKLRKVEFCNCANLTDVMNLCLHCLDLKCLTISRCSLTRDAWEHIFMHGKNLDTLVIKQLEGLNLAGLDAVPSGHHPNVVHLEISECNHVATAAIAEISRICPNIKQAFLKRSTLEADALKGLGHAVTDLNVENTAGFSTRSLLTAIAARPNIRHLHMHSPEWMESGTTVQFLQGLANTADLQLTYLEISSCPIVPEDMVTILLQSCPTLRVFILDLDYNLTCTAAQRAENAAYFERLQRANPGRGIFPDARALKGKMSS